MELDPAAWVVHRHLVDPCLDELDIHRPPTYLGVSPVVPVELPMDLWGLDVAALEALTLETRLLMAGADEVTSAS
jgi:hypothetical protein